MTQATGQLFLREVMAGRDLGPALHGRKLWLVIGVLALPENAFVQGEHQYTVVGYTDNGMLTLETVDDGKDMTDNPLVRGMRADQILCNPIWRV